MVCQAYKKDPCYRITAHNKPPLALKEKIKEYYGYETCKSVALNTNGGHGADGAFERWMEED